jgi:signal transduction histidine kinase
MGVASCHRRQSRGISSDVQRQPSGARGGAMGNLDRKELTCYLASGVGHQVINALSTIVSQGEVLRMILGTSQENRADIDERINTILRTALDSALMTRKLMDDSHEAIAIDPDRPGSDLEEIALDRLAAEVAERERGLLGPSVVLTLDLAPVPAIRGHRHALGEMLGFLIRNASEALAGRPGTVSLHTKAGPPGWITVEVRDDGCGFALDVLERATEPFFTTKAGHRGVGLTIARGIWRRHRGTVAIESEPGKGATVRLMVAARSAGSS